MFNFCDWKWGATFPVNIEGIECENELDEVIRELGALVVEKLQ